VSSGSSIEAVADQVIADDIAPGRPGKVEDTLLAVPPEGPRLGYVLWLLLVLLALLTGLLFGTGGGETEEVTPVPPTEQPTTAPSSSTPTTTSPTTTSPTTTTTAPRTTSVSSITGGWDHPPFAATYTNAATGQPVQGASVVLACMTITNAAPNSLVTVIWTGGGGTVQGVGRTDASGKVTVPGGINSATTYTVQSVQIASPTNPTAQTPLTVPATSTNVTLPNDSLCTP
jgi:hypothetical protein